MGHEDLKNNIRVAAQVINALSFLGLLCTSWFFVYKNVEEFFNDRTSFTASREPLKAKDLPSATICFSAGTKMVYGTDFTVQILANEINSTQKEYADMVIVNLKEGENYYRHPQNDRTAFLRQLTVAQVESKYFVRSCIAITWTLNGVPENASLMGDYYYGFTIGHIFVKISGQIDNREVYGASLYLTSSKNLYGAVNKFWFDGKVQEFSLLRGKSTTIKIKQAKKYVYLTTHCITESFYEAMSSIVTNQATNCNENGKPCSPYSLPGEEPFVDLPICSEIENKESICHNESFLLMKQNYDKQKTCVVQEFIGEQVDDLFDRPLMKKTALNKILKDSMDVNAILREQNDTYAAFLSIVNPYWSRGFWSIPSNPNHQEIVQDVYKEYPLWTKTSLVGSIGGQLGLLVGFSVTGSINWALSTIQKMLEHKLQ